MGVDSKLAKADNTCLDRSSMVTENLRRLEKQDEESKPVFETALMKAASTTLAGE